MTEISIAPGLSLVGYDLAGLNGYLNTRPSLGAGVIVAISGSLEPGQTDFLVFSGQPIRDAAAESLNTSLIRAAVLVMSPYFDVRHARVFAAGIMRAIANARQLGAVDDTAAEALEYDEIPSGDIALVKMALIQIADKLDDVLDYPLLAIKTAADAAAAE